MEPVRPVSSALETSPPAAGLGGRLKALRQERGWTLADAAEATGIARSSLSKIENGQMSPTYDLLLKLARGFAVDIADLFADAQVVTAPGRMAVSRAKTGQHHLNALYDHEILAGALARKKIQPFRTAIKPLAKGASPNWSGHSGEEFLYVLSGRVIFYTEHYEPVTLEAGDSLYIDSSMRHAAASAGPGDAEVLWVTAA
ncbi:MAG: transcriptional regulator [Proteobacteria bacterium]|nr:MAG: transcriptional regulator [Pseudomonadota bacterium]